MSFDRKWKLFQVADSQMGYFTSQQAEACGFYRSHFHRFVKSGEWVREIQGVYRLAYYPVLERSELVLWMLWSRNKKGDVQGVWSHETALDIHELSDVMPSKMHMTVPYNFRRRAEIPKVLQLHYANLEQEGIEMGQGYRVTTPLRTLIDVFNASSIADNFLSQALLQALERGLVYKNELHSLKNSHLETYLKMRRLSHGYL